MRKGGASCSEAGGSLALHQNTYVHDRTANTHVQDAHGGSRYSSSAMLLHARDLDARIQKSGHGPKANFETASDSR